MKQKSDINLVSSLTKIMKQHNRSQLVAEKKLIRTLPKIKINGIFFQLKCLSQTKSALTSIDLTTLRQ